MGEAYQNEKNYVFTREDGSIIDTNHLSKRFSKLAKRQGLDINFHGLRHTYCSILLSKGVDVKTVQIWHGDATQRWYWRFTCMFSPARRKKRFPNWKEYFEAVTSHVPKINPPVVGGFERKPYIKAAA